MAASRYYVSSAESPNGGGRIGSVVRFGWTRRCVLLAPVLLLGRQGQQTAMLLDAAPWHGRTYVCVETSDRILIGQKRGRPGRWTALRGKTVGVRYDDARLWVAGAKFRQDYLTRAFPAGSRCEQVVDAAIARRDSDQPKQLRTR
jgi:hypothetical protein